MTAEQPPPPLAQSLDPPLEVKWFGISLLFI